MREHLDHLLGNAHPVVQQHDRHAGIELTHQRRQCGNHLTGLGHHQQTLDLAGVADKSAFDIEQLDMPLQRGEIDPRMERGLMMFAQQDTGGLTTLGQQGGKNAAEGATTQQ